MAGVLFLKERTNFEYRFNTNKYNTNKKLGLFLALGTKMLGGVA